MSSPRVRRLQSDYERIFTRFAGWPLVHVVMGPGLPPDMYRIIYNIKGLRVASSGRILEWEEHVLEIKLGLEYPRRAPQLRLLTPIFHPNFNQAEVCAQDIYAASEGLDDLIIRIGRMIAYQEYNTKSPLNGIAAKWAAENSHRLPVDRREIAPPAPGVQSTTRHPPLPRHTQVPQNDALSSKIIISTSDVNTDIAVKTASLKVNASAEQPMESTITQQAKVSPEAGKTLKGEAKESPFRGTVRGDTEDSSDFPFLAELERYVYSYLLRQEIDEVTMIQAKVKAEGDRDKAEAFYYKIKYQELQESGQIERFKTDLLAEKTKIDVPSGAKPVYKSKEQAHQFKSDAEVPLAGLRQKGILETILHESAIEHDQRVRAEIEEITAKAIKDTAEEKERRQKKEPTERGTINRKPHQ